MLTEKKLQELVGLVREENEERYNENWLKILQEIGQMSFQELNQFNEAIGLKEKDIEEDIEKQSPNFVLAVMVKLTSQKSKLFVEQCRKETDLEKLSVLMEKSFPHIFLVPILVDMLADELKKVAGDPDATFQFSYVAAIALAALSRNTWKNVWDEV